MNKQQIKIGDKVLARISKRKNYFGKYDVIESKSFGSLKTNATDIFEVVGEESSYYALAVTNTEHSSFTPDKYTKSDYNIKKKVSAICLVRKFAVTPCVKSQCVHCYAC